MNITKSKLHCSLRSNESLEISRTSSLVRESTFIKRNLHIHYFREGGGEFIEIIKRKQIQEKFNITYC